ncbi:DUF4224 domain-containing protein [Shewanella loihica]|uniref:DUF4224 domain-containing protein n=1 Tax=Shewanella loihica TaxID=359303 RepID=UPI00059EBDC0|nr:DUF4224 domain-containing protein [Shewanella loihica]
MDLLLTDDEVTMLTDYEKPKAQCRQLMKMGITFEVGRTGKPKVLRDAVKEKLGGSSFRKRKEPAVNVAALSGM